ncbi:MAG: hypothetical protein ACO2ZM_08205 [Francisellaceae bacterium]
MRKSIIVIVVCLAFFYPFVVYFSLMHSIRLAALVVVVLMSLRIMTIKRHKKGISQGNIGLMAGCVFGIVLGLLSMLTAESGFIRFYPVAISLIMLTLFMITLFNPPNMIYRIASFTGRIDDGSEALAYTRKITLIWCVFFVINATIAVLSMLAPISLWTLYNGFISYMIMGGLLIGEGLYRHLRLQKKKGKT